MDSGLLARIEQVEAAARHCRVCHRSRRDGYEGLTLNEQQALAELTQAIAAVTGEAVSPLSETAA